MSNSTGGNGGGPTVQNILATARGLYSRNEFYGAITATDPIASNANLGNAIERERIFVLRAECLLSVKQFIKAEKEARAAVLIAQGGSPQAQFVLGASLLGQFKIAEAVDAFDLAEALMHSPQPWRYALLPEDEARSNSGSVAAAQQRSAAGVASPTRERGIELVPRRYRDIGVDDPALVPVNDRLRPGSSSPSPASTPTKQQKAPTARELRPPLLPPPAVTYEWQGAYNAYKAEEAQARRLDTAQATRLLPRGGLILGLRMMEQLAKKAAATKFLVATLRNDTDYDLVYQFHTCGSEDSDAAAAAAARQNTSAASAAAAAAPTSSTQFLYKFPHVIPPGMVGAAIISCDSWRARMITLSATVCFALRRTKQQQDAIDERSRARAAQQHQAESDRDSKSAAAAAASNSPSTTPRQASANGPKRPDAAAVPISPLLRFSFSLSVMNSVTASVVSPTSSHKAPVSQPSSKDKQPAPNAESVTFDGRSFCAFARNAFPTLNYPRGATAGSVAGTQTDVVLGAIPAAFLSVVQRTSGVRTSADVHGSGSGGGGGGAACKTRLSPVLAGCVAQYMQPRPLRLAACISTAWRTVVSSFPPPRFEDYPYGATMPDYLLARDVRASPFTVRTELSAAQVQQFLIRQQQQQREDEERAKNYGAGGAVVAVAPPISSGPPQPPLAQWSVKREDGSIFRMLVLRNRRNDAVLHIVGSHTRNEDYFVKLPGGTHGRGMVCRVASTKGFFDSVRSANVLWPNPFAPPGDTENAVRVAAKISQQVANGEMRITVCPVALQQQPAASSAATGHHSAAATAAVLAAANSSGWELTIPHPLKRTPQSVAIRDMVSKSVVARVDMDNGIYQLKFFQVTDALWCAILAGEYLVSW